MHVKNAEILLTTQETIRNHSIKMKQQQKTL